MAKIRRILAFPMAVMIFFMLSLGLAGCREEKLLEGTDFFYKIDTAYETNITRVL